MSSLLLKEDTGNLRYLYFRFHKHPQSLGNILQQSGMLPSQNCLKVLHKSVLCTQIFSLAVFNPSIRKIWDDMLTIKIYTSKI